MKATAMTKIIYSVLAIGVLGAGSFIFPWQYEPESVSAATVHARKILYYVDPMHPAYKSDKPGIAPDCGMQLEPVYEDSQQHSASDGTAARNIRPQASTVNISAEKQQLIGVRVSTAEQASGTEKLHLFGRVAPDGTGPRDRAGTRRHRRFRPRHLDGDDRKSGRQGPVAGVVFSAGSPLADPGIPRCC